jgi:hypothetical protein
LHVTGLSGSRESIQIVTVLDSFRNAYFIETVASLKLFFVPEKRMMNGLLRNLLIWWRRRSWWSWLI